jgi:hypothetical protein
VLRKTGPSEGWNALLEADGLDLSVERMVLDEDAVWAPPFTDEDRALARSLLDDQRAELTSRAEREEAAQIENDRQIVTRVAESRRNNRECFARAELVKRLVDHCNESRGDSWDKPPLSVVHAPQAGHGVLLRVQCPDLMCDSPPASPGISVTRALLRRARVAVGPGCSLGFDGPEERLAVGSVGLKATYPATALAEAVAALAAGVAGFETATGVTPGVSEANHGLEVAGTDGFFEGRGLIERAFVDRLLPILERCRA